MSRRTKIFKELIDELEININESDITNDNLFLFIQRLQESDLDLSDEFRGFSIFEKLESLKKSESEKTKLEKLQEIFEDIDWEIGIGPSEEIIDEKQIKSYIQNFKEKFKDHDELNELLNIHDEEIGLSFMERLDEF